jgi:hypothetical protein
MNEVELSEAKQSSLHALQHKKLRMSKSNNNSEMKGGEQSALIDDRLNHNQVDVVTDDPTIATAGSGVLGGGLEQEHSTSGAFVRPTLIAVLATVTLFVTFVIYAQVTRSLVRSARYGV